MAFFSLPRSPGVPFFRVSEALMSQLVGPDASVLLMQLPDRMTGETVIPLQQEVDARLPRIPGAGLVLDFSGVQIVSSIAITALLQLDDACRQRGVRLILTRLPEQIMRFLRQLKLETRFVVVQAVDGAIARAAGGRGA